MAHEIEMAWVARRLPTQAARRLSSRLRRGGPGWHFRRQHPIPPDVPDFACPRLKVAIQTDGGQHSEAAWDVMPDAFLQQHGWMVLRFWNNEVLTNMDGVVAVIQEVRRPRVSPPPQPSAAKRGRFGEGATPVPPVLS